MTESKLWKVRRQERERVKKKKKNINLRIDTRKIRRQKVEQESEVRDVTLLLSLSLPSEQFKHSTRQRTRFRSRINGKIITSCVFYVHWSDTQLTIYSCNSPWSVKYTTQRKLPFKYINFFASKLKSNEFKCKVAILQEKLSSLALKISAQKIKRNRFTIVLLLFCRYPTCIVWVSSFRYP